MSIAELGKTRNSGRKKIKMYNNKKRNQGAFPLENTE